MENTSHGSNERPTSQDERTLESIGMGRTTQGRGTSHAGGGKGKLGPSTNITEIHADRAKIDENRRNLHADLAKLDEHMHTDRAHLFEY